MVGKAATNYIIEVGSGRNEHVLFTEGGVKIAKKQCQIQLGSRKPGNVDVNVRNSISIPPRGDSLLYSQCSLAVSIACIVLLTLTMRHLHFELLGARENIAILSKRVDILEDTVHTLRNMLSASAHVHPRTVGDAQVHSTDNSSDSDNPSAVVDLLEYHETKHLSLNNMSDALDSPTRQGRVKRSTRRGPTVLHLNGALPEKFIEDGGSLIAPWYEDEKAAGNFAFENYEFKEGAGSVRVTEPGLYYIYAQVYYLTSEAVNSYVISVKNEGKSTSEDLAVCSSTAMDSSRISEVSCFTSIVHFLNATDQIYLWQRERKRRVIFRDGSTFLGIVPLNGPNTRRS